MPHPVMKWLNFLSLPPLSPVLMLLLLLLSLQYSSIYLTDSCAHVPTQPGVWVIDSYHKSIRLNEEWHKQHWFTTVAALCQLVTSMNSHGGQKFKNIHTHSSAGAHHHWNDKSSSKALLTIITVFISSISRLSFLTVHQAVQMKQRLPMVSTF